MNDIVQEVLSKEICDLRNKCSIYEQSIAYILTNYSQLNYSSGKKLDIPFDAIKAMVDKKINMAISFDKKEDGGQCVSFNFLNKEN